MNPSEIIITTPNGPSGQSDSNISSFHSSEEKATSPELAETRNDDPCDQFCQSVHKLRQLWNGRSIPPLSKDQCGKIRQLFGEVKFYSLKKLLWIYIASWSHWDSVRGDYKKKFVEGFHAKFFWPPEQGLKHVGKIEDFLMYEATVDKAWADDLIKEVRKAVSAASTLPQRGRR